MTLRSSASPVWFGASLLVVYLAAFLVAEVLPHTLDPGAVAAGLTVDLVVLVPLLYYALLVRGRGWPSITVAPVFLLSVGAASWLVPPEHHGLLNGIGYALPVAEVAVLGFVGYKAWRVARANRQARVAGGDVYDRLRDTMRGAFDAPAVAGAFAYELSLVHYAFAGRAAERRPEAFAYHRRGGYGAVVAALLMAASLELVGVHFLIRSWSTTATWIHAGLSLYGVVWLVGDYRAMRRRPHELLASGLRVRLGIRWDLGAAWEQVAVLRRTRRPVVGDDALSAVAVGDPQYVVEFHEPVEATGPYGMTRRVRRVGFGVDDPAAFEERLHRLGVPLDPDPGS